MNQKTTQTRSTRGRGTRFLFPAFFRFVTHERHDDDHGGPKQYLLMPEKHFPIVEEDGCEHDGAADEAVAEGRVFDDGIRPDGDPAEIDHEGKGVDLESAA